MRFCLRRREFIAGPGGAAVSPLGARAQQRERMRRIGVLVPSSGATHILLRPDDGSDEGPRDGLNIASN
jgi:hypothetical protein